MLVRQDGAKQEFVLDAIKNMDLKSISSGLKEQINQGGAAKIIDFVLKNLKK